MTLFLKRKFLFEFSWAGGWGWDGVTGPIVQGTTFLECERTHSCVCVSVCQLLFVAASWFSGAQTQCNLNQCT